MWISILYDLAAVVLILAVVTRNARRGFAATVVGIVGHLAALAGALFLANLGAKTIYQLFLHSRVETLLQENLNLITSASPDLAQLEAAIVQTLDQLPRFLVNASGLGNFGESDLAALMAGGMTMTFQAVEETLVRPAVTGLVSLLLFVVLFAIFAFLARRLSGLAGWVCRSPLLQPADRFLGGVIGAGEALVELYLICVALQLVLAFFGDMTYLNRQILGDTIIWSWLGNFDFSALLG